MLTGGKLAIQVFELLDSSKSIEARKQLSSNGMKAPALNNLLFCKMKQSMQNNQRNLITIQLMNISMDLIEENNNRSCWTPY